MDYDKFKEFNYKVNKTVERLMRSTGPLIFTVEPHEKKFLVKDKNSVIVEVFNTRSEAEDKCGVLNLYYDSAIKKINELCRMELEALSEEYFRDAEYSYVQLSEIEQKAWELYCEETAGEMDVKDFWQELPLYVQHIYLEKVRYDKSKHQA